MLFSYTAKDRSGATITGTVEASTKEAAGRAVSERGLIVLSLTPKKEGFGAGMIFKGVKGVPLEEKAVFARQMATMIGAGLRIPEALEILQAQTANASMKEVLAQVLADVEGGASFAKALSRFTHVFSRVFVALIEAGEASGKLDQMLLRLADNLEKERDFKGKIKGAMIYPIIVLIAMGAVFTLMVVVVIPKLTEIYEGIGAELPLPTKILLGISDFIKGFWWLLIFGSVGGFYLFRKYTATDLGRYQWALFSFKFPVFGKLQRDSMLAEFCRTLGLLISGGLAINDALEITAGVVGNVLYQESILAAGKQVQKGVPLSTPLKADKNFPPLVSQMVAVGEETGQLDDVLIKVAAYFEAESEQRVRNLSTAMEPFIMILLGIMVGLLIMSIITPIYNLTSQF